MQLILLDIEKATNFLEQLEDWNDRTVPFSVVEIKSLVKFSPDESSVFKV